MRREKHITIKATLLAIIATVVGAYELYEVGNFVDTLRASDVIKNMETSMGYFLSITALTTLVLMFVLSLLEFGRHYDQMPIFNIMFAYMLGFGFGTLCGLIRHYFFWQYYGTVGMRIVEVFLILCMFVVPHRLYSMRRYEIKEVSEKNTPRKL